MSLRDEIKVEVKAYLSNKNEDELKNDLRKIQEREYSKLQDAKYIILRLFLQLGTPEYEDVGVLDFRNKNDIWLYFKAKIKNYMIFKSEENYLKYKEEELDENDLYLAFEVKNGKIVDDSDDDVSIKATHSNGDYSEMTPDGFFVYKEGQGKLKAYITDILDKSKDKNSVGIGY